MNFKKTLSIGFCLFTFLCYSQTDYKTNFGFKLGLNNSVINGFEPDGTKTGYAGTELYTSFFADTKIWKNTSLENEVLYSFTDDYHFIEIPIHLKNKLYKGIYLFYGGKLDFLAVNSDIEGEIIKPTGVSLELGAQYFFTTKFFTELRYSNGLTEQFELFMVDIQNAKRNTLRLGIGVKF